MVNKVNIINVSYDVIDCCYKRNLKQMGDLCESYMGDFASCRPIVYSFDCRFDTIDVQLVDGKTYYLKMQVWAYAGAGLKANADLISANDIPARDGDGVNYNSISISWL